MKILIDARMYGLENAGIGRYLINLIAELAKCDSSDDFVILLRKKYFKTVHLPKNFNQVLADFKHYTWKEQFLLPLIIAKERPDLVHYPHLNTPLFQNCRYVVTVHDLTMQKQGTNASTLSLPAYYLKRIPFLLDAFLSVKRAVKVIAPSYSAKEEIMNYYHINSNKIKTIYLGIGVFKKSKSEANNEQILGKYEITRPYFFYVGNAYPHKNLGNAIEAIKILNERFSAKATLVIAGSRDVFKQRLEKKIEEVDAGKYVSLLGYVPDEDLINLYNNSISFIYPSLSEGFGLQGLEAMLNGTILLASDTEVFKEVYRDNAFYFDAVDPMAIAEAMKNVINLPENQKKKVIEKSQKFLNKYSWSKMAKETLELYENSYSL